MRRGLVVLSLALGLSTALAAEAERPSGSYEIDVGGDQALGIPREFDASSCDQVAGVNICFDGELASDGSGGVTGTVLASFTGDIDGNLVASIGGRISGAVADPRIRLRMDLAGRATVAGTRIDVQGTHRATCSEDSRSDDFRCRGRITLCMVQDGRRLGCGSESVDFPLRRTAGPWQLRLELATDPAGVVSGRGRVELANGQLFDYGVSGEYDAQSDQSKLSLVGTGLAGHSKLRLSSLTLAAETAMGGRLDFQVLGQKGRTSLPAAQVMVSVDPAIRVAGWGLP